MSMAFYFIIFFFFFLSLFTAAQCTTSSEQDLLLSFKPKINDPTSSLSSWSQSTHICNYTGITCSGTSPPSVFSIDLQNLNISGDISASICKLPNLSHLNLAHNSFNNPIPLHLSQCSSLLYLNLSSNLLWGTLPDQISQLTLLTVLDISFNHIEGQIPLALGSLKSLQALNLRSNLFSGNVHSYIFKNLSELVFLDMSENLLNSLLPSEVERSSNLSWIYMHSSGFYGDIPESFLGMENLQVLDLSRNNLTGKIPVAFGSKLMSLDLSQNKLSGSFPINICTVRSIVEIRLNENLLTGSVPKTIEQCLRLERFEIHNNVFSGELPSGLWSLPKIKVIRAENNHFSGNLPETIKVPSSIEQIQIDSNNFSGKIPQALGRINTMYRFSASRNNLFGSLPENIFDSPVLSIVNLSHNSLSGIIPEFRNCKRLVSLSLAENNFSGNIPNTLAHLPVLTYIDLSNNNLGGEIPKDMQNLKLALFNVSFNKLSGPVPASLVNDLPASFLQGNPDLCGPRLPNRCDENGQKSSINGLFVALITISFVVGLMVLGLGIFTLYKFSHNNSSSIGWKTVLFYPLKISGEDLVMALEEKSSIGRGPFGKTYLLQLPIRQFVVVRRVENSKNSSFKTLEQEIKTLGKAEHKNLTKLLGFCYSDCDILLIYKHYRMRSLGDVLSNSNIELKWKIRLQIALGTARGLAYLHKDLVHLLHRNLKCNNILLDEDFEPKITDYGLDRVVGDASFLSTMNSDLNSCCYAPPEQRCSKKATEQMDIYSFGVVLLELITGKRTQADQIDSKDTLDVVKWVRRKVNMTNGSFQVLDPKNKNSNQEAMLSALELALRCTSVMPEKRPTIEEIIRKLEALSSNGESSKST